MEGIVSVCWIALGVRCEVDVLACEEFDSGGVWSHVPLEICV